VDDQLDDRLAGVREKRMQLFEAQDRTHLLRQLRQQFQQNHRNAYAMRIYHFKDGPQKGEIDLNATLESMAKYEKWTTKPDWAGAFLYAVATTVEAWPERRYDVSFDSATNQVTIYRAL
jgi:hypothetical protein